MNIAGQCCKPAETNGHQVISLTGSCLLLRIIKDGKGNTKSTYQGSGIIYGGPDVVASRSGMSPIRVQRAAKGQTSWTTVPLIGGMFNGTASSLLANYLRGYQWFPRGPESIKWQFLGGGISHIGGKGSTYLPR